MQVAGLRFPARNVAQQSRKVFRCAVLRSCARGTLQGRPASGGPSTFRIGRKRTQERGEKIQSPARAAPARRRDSRSSSSRKIARQRAFGTSRTGRAGEIAVTGKVDLPRRNRTWPRASSVVCDVTGASAPQGSRVACAGRRPRRRPRVSGGQSTPRLSDYVVVPVLRIAQVRAGRSRRSATSTTAGYASCTPGRRACGECESPSSTISGSCA